MEAVSPGLLTTGLELFAEELPASPQAEKGNWGILNVEVGFCLREIIGFSNNSDWPTLCLASSQIAGPGARFILKTCLLGLPHGLKCGHLLKNEVGSLSLTHTLIDSFLCKLECLMTQNPHSYGKFEVEWWTAASFNGMPRSSPGLHRAWLLVAFEFVPLDNYCTLTVPRFEYSIRN